MSLASSALPLLELCNLTLGYERHPAVHHLSLPLHNGALVAIVGPNGAGKSTLVKALAGVLQPMQGQIKGLPTAPTQGGGPRWWTTPRPRYRVAYLPQQAEMDKQFPITVFDMVCMGLWHEVGALGRLSATQRQRCEAALARVGLSGFAHRSIGTLSGGQFQRALFARLLLQDAQLILLDEPFVGVDTRTTRDLLALLHEWHAQGRTVVAVLHDMEQVRLHFPTTWLLARELVAAGPTAEVLTPEHLAQARTLNEAFDETAPDCEVPERPDALTAQAAAHTHPHGHTHDHTHAHHHALKNTSAYASK